MIENIESFSAELQIQCLTNFYLLEQRSVERHQARATEGSARHVPESPWGRHHESPRIEPLIRFPQNHGTLEVRIPVRYVGLIGVAGPGNIGTRQRREWESALSVDDSIPLPAADQMIDNSTGAVSKALPVPKRHLIAEISVELVLEAVGRDPAV